MSPIAADEYRSVGHLGHLPQQSLDVAAPGAARQIASTRAYRGEIILFTAEEEMAGWGFHWVNQLRTRGYEHWLILSDGAENCRKMHEKWRAVQAVGGDEPLSCVFSSYPKSHAGWRQWAGAHGRVDKMHRVYVLWASRWWVALALLREQVNVLSLDVDAVLLTDIYQLLRAPPIVQQDVLITRNDDGSQSLNCGFVYFNRDAGRFARGASLPKFCDGGGPLEIEAEMGTLAAARAPEADVVPAAEWVAELMWEVAYLLTYFLTYLLTYLGGSPSSCGSGCVSFWRSSSTASAASRRGRCYGSRTRGTTSPSRSNFGGGCFRG